MATLARSLDRSRFRPLVGCQHELGPVADEMRAADVPVHLLSGKRRFDPAFLHRTRALVRREKVRVILTHGFSTGVVGRLAGWLGGAPVRLPTEHSVAEPEMTPVKHAVNRLLTGLTTGWIALARGQLGYLTETKGIPRGRIHVIPNGIDAAPFSPRGARERIRAELGIPAGAPVAGILAVLRPEKDHRTFLLAARFVADESPEARFLLVGDGPLEMDLRREASALGLDGRVVFTGRRSDVADVLSAFDVAVLCSINETLPLAFLEAMATGLPLVGTRVGGLPEMIEEGGNGFLVSPRDPRGLADALIQILGNPELARRLGSRSRRRVESEFGLETMTRAYEDLFERLLREAGVTIPAASAGSG